MAGDVLESDDQVDAVHNPFRRVWWLPVVRGIAFIVLGLLLLIEPLHELDVMRMVVGAFLVLDALLVLVQWSAHRRQVGATWWLAQAGVNALFGVAVAFWPDVSPTVLYYVLASWTIVLGIVAVVGGVALARNRDLGWAWLVTFGLTAGLFGMLLVIQPLDTVDVLRLVTIVFALFAFVAGSIHLVSGFAVRSVARELRDLREQAEKAGIRISGGSVLGAANPAAAPAHAQGPRFERPATGPAVETSRGEGGELHAATSRAKDSQSMVVGPTTEGTSAAQEADGRPGDTDLAVDDDVPGIPTPEERTT
ncbi:uncharacterized membrane protein HdeD (DUF308 family) [Isoptericola jiangsuensis]|uniref:Uncharacterized membrane protein HdeD (DUF308 family) n=1 Tax=Isoptericola jiangsuensis TaxID=548579 RepID=A0A2A9F2B8_9MICO|nr:DUF308 domain-containing protein [Isoptericola jiangsuensis]PFG44660.1 uncharacterized membrane protein HdeD (DUF308 family) [Isoptericola jiangsuensis]